MIRTTASLLTLGLALPAMAAPTLDGTRDAEYGAPLAVQTVETQFGDSTGGLTGGGELDAIYATVTGGRLYVMITGNIENNFNKLSVFIDSKAGGENTLSGTPNYDGGRSSNFAGLTFDTGFDADFHLFGRWGGFSGNVFEVDIYDRAGGVSASVNGNGGAASVGGGTAVQSGTITPGNVAADAAAGFLTQNLNFGFDNTNSAGVLGGTGAADPVAAAAVATGFEFSIALADLGVTAPGTIKIHAAYGNGDNNYHSNQILGGLPAGTGNLGGDGGGGFTGNLGGINFNQYAGDQFVEVVVPEPASAALLGLAGLALTRRR